MVGINGYLFLAKRSDATLLWTGSRWQHEDGPYQICNFYTVTDALIYASKCGLRVHQVGRCRV